MKKELETLIEVANHISNNMYKSTFDKIQQESKTETKQYKIQSTVDFLYSYIKDSLKNSEDITILENKIYNILNIRSTADADDYTILEFNTKEIKKIWDNLDPYLHNGERHGEDDDQWVNQVYPKFEPEFYGIYKVRGY